MSTLCLDLGATYIKAALFDSAGAMSESARVPFPAFLDELGPRREVETTKILEAVEALLARVSGSRGKSARVMVSCQMQGFVFVDKKTLKPLSHFISWQDGRSLKYREELDAHVDARLRGELGNEWKPGHAATTWYALRMEKELPVGAVPLSIGDFVIAAMSGSLPRMHATNASGFGCWNVARAEWAREVPRRLGLEDVSLPDATVDIVPQGETRYGPIMSCIGDQQAALYGAGLGSSQISINVATGSQVSCLATSFGGAEAGFQTRPYFEGRYLRTITHLPAGRAVTFLLAALGGRIEDIELPIGFTSDLRVNLSFFPGALGERGALENIREGNLTKEDALYAAYEAMSSNYRDAIAKLDPRAEKTELLGSGGMLLKSRLLREMLVAKTGRKLVPSASEEDALTGLFKLSASVR